MRNPAVNETLEGWWILHRMFAFDRLRWLQVEPADRKRMSSEIAGLLHGLHSGAETDAGVARIVGHKADLMFTHYAKAYGGLARVQLDLDCCEIAGFLEPRDSYTSVLELGLYDATAKIHAALAERGLKRFSAEWNAAFDELLEDQRRNARNAERLWARIPQRRYVCFYPMDKKREGGDNWYVLPFEERARLMLDHGKIGRTFHGSVNQVISGSIGFDDYEWGVDLYADDPVVFKKLIYEMRFDEASSRYAAFGPFYSGLQLQPEELGEFLEDEAAHLPSAPSGHSARGA
jgi:peroxiredoxin